MSFYPLMHVLFWIAVALAPAGTTQIEIDAGSDAESWTWTLQDGAWLHSRDQSTWKVDGTQVTVTRTDAKPPEQKLDVAAFVKGVQGHDWTKTPSLQILQATIVQKTGGTFEFRFGGATSKPWTIRYVQGDKDKASEEESTKVEKKLPLPGEVFEVDGHTAFVILPAKTGKGPTPWVWYAPTLPNYPSEAELWMFQKFVDAGIAIAGIDVGESYGSPQGRALFSKLYLDLTEKRGFSKLPCLLPRSRGGLMLYNWAVENPHSVSAIAGIYPVADLRSYPGLKKAAPAYGMTEEQLAAQLGQHNPVNRISPLAKAKVPLFIIHGDVDEVVPLDKNSGRLVERYREFGGEATLIVPPGQGHSHWRGYFECQELVDFVIANAK